MNVGVFEAWPYWSGNSNVYAYLTNNAVAVRTGRCDGCHFHELFAYHYQKNWSIYNYAGGSNPGAQPAGATYYGTADRIYADSATYGVYIESGANNVQINIGELIDQGPPEYQGTLGSQAVVIAGSGAFVNIGKLETTILGSSIASISAQTSRLHINSATIGGWGLAGSAAGLLSNYANSNIVIDDYAFDPAGANIGYPLFGAYTWKSTPNLTAPSATWTFDLTGAAATTVASNGTIVLPAGSGELTLVSGTSGSVCKFILGGGNIKLIAQTGTDCATAAGTGVVSLTYTNSAYTLTNGTGASDILFVANTRIRGSN